ncbi:hypothetical protein EIP86_004406 [Pleurotus ostreatoroseus]|nr:hypothetical protein EIP86_004406 [Pleurotus ostreatoroseus]
MLTVNTSKPNGILTQYLAQTQDLRFLGQIKFGIYAEDYSNEDEVHPDTTAEFRLAHVDDIEDKLPNAQDLADYVEECERTNLRHDGIPVPRHTNPFQTPEELEDYLALLQRVKSVDADSEGFGVELIDAPDYPVSEHIIFGRGGRKELEIPLPFEYLLLVVFFCTVSATFHILSTMMDAEKATAILAFCRGAKVGEPECDCEEYSAPSGVDASARCLECGHGKTLTTVESAVGGPSRDSGSTESVVRKMYNARTSRPTINSSGKSNVSHQDARNEVLRGFRPHNAGTSGLSTRAAAKAKRAASDSRAGTHKVGGVYLMVCGIYLDENGEEHLEDKQSPSVNGHDILENLGLGVTSLEGISINQNWTYEEVSAWLRGLFPRAFEYMETYEQEKRVKPKTHSPVKWRLLSKRWRALEVSVKTKPTGADLIKHKGGANSSKTSISNSHLYFAFFHAVSPEVLSSWKPRNDDESEDARSTSSEEAQFSDRSESSEGSYRLHMNNDSTDPESEPDWDASSDSEKPAIFDVFPEELDGAEGAIADMDKTPRPARLRKRTADAAELDDSPEETNQARPTKRARGILAGEDTGETSKHICT